MTLRLIGILRRLSSLLQLHRVRYATVVENYVKRLESSNTDESVDNIVGELREQMLGGMGSLNDVWISKENGHAVDSEEVANAKLELLRDELRQALS